MRRFSILFLTLFLFTTLSLANGKIRPISTYSIVAYDRETGQLGVAVQSHWFSVGPIVPWVESGIGAIATQSFVEVSYGPLGLALLKAGKSPEDVIKAYTKAMDMYPNNAEMIFWPAVTLAASGNVEKSLPLFKKVFSMDENWAILLTRLPKVDQLPDDKALVQKILSMAPGKKE